MNELIANFPDNILEAIELGKRNRFTFPKEKYFHQVVISGLGGSGIGGKVISNIVQVRAKIPVVINNTYDFCNFVNENTLVIICSYSGNTEETISAFEEALKRKATIICITSGGEIAERAKELDLPLLKIPSGQPPRTSFGFNATQQFFALYYAGIIDDFFIGELNLVAEVLKEKQHSIKEKARQIATEIAGTIPVIYSDAAYEGVSIRFRQQLNENSKILCWNHVFPEMNHNELVGWAGGDSRFSVVLFRNLDDPKRVSIRMDLSMEVFRNKTSKVVEVWSEGNSRLERSYYLIHLGDWISYFLAEILNVDPLEIEVIDNLKDKLARF